VTGQAKVGLLAGEYAIAVPVAFYWVGLWFVRDRHVLRGAAHHVLLVFAALILLAPLIAPIEGIALLAILSVILRNRVAGKAAITSTT